MKDLRVLNLGAGVQSTTVYLMYVRGEIDPPIEYAIFADTGEEPKAVYQHIQWLQSLGGPPILVRSAGKLGDNLLRGCNSTGQRFVSIPAYTASAEGKQIGIVRRQCTSEYKVKVVEKCIRRELLGLQVRQRIPADVTVYQAYGISIDEAGRAVRIKERMKTTPRFAPVFPLIDKRMTRADCLHWLNRVGVPHTVEKSACTFCPFRSNAEWRRLRDTDPEGWQRAIEIDRGLRIPGAVVNRGMNQQMYLHRSCVPLEKAHLGDPDPRADQLSLNWIPECTGMCGL